MSGGTVWAALRALGIMGRADVLMLDRPVPYLGPWPIRQHRTVAEADAAVRGPAASKSRQAVGEKKL